MRPSFFQHQSIKQNQESTMKLAIAGGSVVDAAHFNESLLEIITRRLRQLIDTLKQPGRP